MPKTRQIDHQRTLFFSITFSFKWVCLSSVKLGYFCLPFFIQTRPALHLNFAERYLIFCKILVLFFFCWQKHILTRRQNPTGTRTWVQWHWWIWACSRKNVQSSVPAPVHKREHKHLRVCRRHTSTYEDNSTKVIQQQKALTFRKTKAARTFLSELTLEAHALMEKGPCVAHHPLRANHVKVWKDSHPKLYRKAPPPKKKLTNWHKHTHHPEIYHQCNLDILTIFCLNWLHTFWNDESHWTK